jgi:hypothetical protein
MKKRIPFYVILSVAFYLAGCAGGERSLDLCRDGVSEYRIVLNPGASASEKFAAEELSEHFKLCTGVGLPISETPAGTDSPMIVLGCGELSRKLGVDPSRDRLGVEGCLIQTAGKNVVIAGTPEVGTLNGTHRFLEDYLGVRWYAPGVTKTPAQKTIRLAAVNRIVRPAFEYRNTSYYPQYRDDRKFLTRVGLNSGRNSGTEPLGIQYNIDGNCHTYFNFVSPEEFFDKHPEYFSEINGVRLRDHTQLCLTNPDVLRIVTERMLERMKQDPGARSHDFSQMDYDNICRCPSCQAINDQYKTRGGTQFWFLNQLAERTSKVYPTKLVSTLAYQYTVDPPQGMKLHPNVAIWLCHIHPSCDSHAIGTCSHNAVFKGWAEQWSKLTRHLFIWHYSTDFAHYYCPFPNLRALAGDIRFYRDIGVTGIYFQGMSCKGGGGEFSLLRPYLCMKMSINPDLDANAVIREFLDGYYGAAAEPIRQYINLIHDKVEKDNIHMDLDTNPGEGYLPDEILDRSDKLFDQAEAAAGRDPVLLDRVKVARMPLAYARLFPRMGYAIENQKLTFLGKKGTPADAAAFLQQMKDHGFENYRETDDDPRPMLMLTGLINTQLDVITLQNKRLTLDVVPKLGGRLLRITYKPTGQCITTWNLPSRPRFPYTGGISEIAMPLHEFDDIIAWASPTVVEQTDRSVVMDSQLYRDYQFRRSIKLDDESPVIEMNCVFTSRSEKPGESRLIRHLMSLNLGDMNKSTISFKDQAGQSRTLTKKDLDGLCHGVSLYDKDRPRGQWVMRGNKGLEVIYTFDDAQIASAWYRYYPPELDELEAALFYKPMPVGPGQSVTMRQTIEIRPIKP